ncbi:uncharacterized protein LOC124930630 [Impatiens glandulifera]|uniref:uncharacterized protein LOC124930630 n=1 Tax=Impatiens glandulifera TaxID=253017 RepID=UPI001FB07BEB|nr:uncharacterized protein LOC124930630 [Impatiens glandulifera]
MVDPASARSWGYAIPLGKIMLHYNINTGPGVILPSSKIIRSRQFKERKNNRTASDSTGARRKKVDAKKASPVKEKSGSKQNKQSVESADPRFETPNEEDSASTTNRTASQNTEEDLSGKGKGPMVEVQSASLENADTGIDGLGEEDVHTNDDTQEMAENIVSRIMDKSTSKLARRPKYFVNGSGTDINYSTNKCYWERELTDEVARLEAEPEHQDTPNPPSPRDDGGQNPIDKEIASPPADQTINITDDRTEPPLTDLRASAQTGNLESAVTEERVKTLIEEFVNDAVKPWKRKIKKAAVQAIKITETTKDDLGEAVKRITSVETNYSNTDQLYGSHLDRTKDLEDMTPKLVDDLDSVSKTVAEMERSQETTGQRLTKVEEDLAQSVAHAGSTLDRVIILENKNATLEEKNTKLEADLKAVTEQVGELIEASWLPIKRLRRRTLRRLMNFRMRWMSRTGHKEEAWSDANITEHMRKLAAKNSEIAKTMAAKQAEDANRLKAQQETYKNFEKSHKKSQAAPSSSDPATRKRKATSKKAQMTGLLASVTETVVDPPTNPALQTEDDFEEDVQPPLRRQRVLNAVPIRAMGQQFSPPTGTSGVQGPSSRPVQENKEHSDDELLDQFLPSRATK